MHLLLSEPFYSPLCWDVDGFIESRASCSMMTITGWYFQSFISFGWFMVSSLQNSEVKQLHKGIAAMLCCIVIRSKLWASSSWNVLKMHLVFSSPHDVHQKWHPLVLRFIISQKMTKQAHVQKQLAFAWWEIVLCKRLSLRRLCTCSKIESNVWNVSTAWLTDYTYQLAFMLKNKPHTVRKLINTSFIDSGWISHEQKGLSRNAAMVQKGQRRRRQASW